MNTECLEIGQFQVYLDGELDSASITAFAIHLGECEKCAMAFEQAEAESLKVLSALGGELDTLVPTQRLWERISSEIQSDNRRQSFFGRLTRSIDGLISLEGVAAAAVAIVVVIFGLMDFYQEQPDVPTPSLASNSVASPEASPPSSGNLPLETSDDLPPISSRDFLASSALKDSEIRKIVSQPAVQSSSRISGPFRGEAQIPGEESYIKAIRGLERGIVAQPVSLSVSGRLSLERDLNLIDASIRKMRKVVRRNPQDLSARRILYAAYQDKIDILNSAVRRQDLMASIR